MPDYEKLIDTNHLNLFCVCFCNKVRLPMNQITEIFSQYGKVASINCASIEAGFHFVRYRSIEEARRCVTELEGHPQITLQPVKSKFKVPTKKNPVNKFNKNQSANGDLLKGDNQAQFDAERGSRAGSTRSNQGSANSKLNRPERENEENGARNCFAVVSNADEPCEDNLDNMERFSSDNPKSPKKPRVAPRLARTFPSHKAQDKCENIQNPDNQFNATKFAKLQKRRGINANTFKLQEDYHLIEAYKRFMNMPAVPAAFKPPSIASSSNSLSNSSKKQFMTKDTPPPLIAAGQEEKRHVTIARDVVVANIHSNLGVGNIYQILKDFDPIHISDIETVPEIDIRFCYVYFKTLTDAINVEQFLDGITVCGKHLIILRSQRLEAEANVF